MANNAQIAETAFVDPTAKLGTDCKVLPFSFIDAGVVIGARSVIGPGAVLLRGTHIGEDCIVAGEAVIGSRGFGYTFDGQEHRPIPQVGEVVIDSHTAVGPGACIDRATIDVTYIGSYCEIGALSQIAHNCYLGSGTKIGWGCGLAGSTHLGERVIFGDQVGTAGHSSFGSQVYAQDLTGFTKTKVPENTQWAGYPARKKR